MQIIILFASLIAATAALPIPQACGTDVLCEVMEATDSVLGERGDSATDLSELGNSLVERAPGAGVSFSQEYQWTSLI